MPVHEQLVNDLTTAADSLNINSPIRREFTKYDFISYNIFNVHTMNIIIFVTIGGTYLYYITEDVGAQNLRAEFAVLYLNSERKAQNSILLSVGIIY